MKTLLNIVIVVALVVFLWSFVPPNNFQYGDKVLIKSGFYEGYTGTIKGSFPPFGETLWIKIHTVDKSDSIFYWNLQHLKEE